MAGVFGSLSHAVRTVNRQARRAPRRSPPQQVLPAVQHAVRQVERQAPTAVRRAPRITPKDVQSVSKAVRHAAREITPPKHGVGTPPIANPFFGNATKSPPFALERELLGLRSRGALRRSYTQPVALREYGQFLRGTYAKARKFYPGSTHQMPAFDFADPQHQYDLHASVFGIDPRSGRVIPTNKRSVHFTPQDAWSYVLQHNNRNDAGDFAQFAPLHEWVHVNQRSPDVLNYSGSSKSHALIEGGAQAFAQDIAPYLGLPVQSTRSNPQYAGLSSYVRRTKGPKYIHGGQFGY